MAWGRYRPRMGVDTGKPQRQEYTMFSSSDPLWSQVRQRQHEMIADAARQRLLTAARRRRRERRGEGEE